MKLRMMWTAMMSLAAFSFAGNALAVDKQMSPGLKKKMQAICGSKGGVPGGWQVAKVTPGCRALAQHDSASNECDG